MQDKDIIQGGTVAPGSALPHQSCRSLSCSPDKVRQLYIFLSKSGHPSGLRERRRAACPSLENIEQSLTQRE
jgi:hypothetical protein